VRQVGRIARGAAFDVLDDFVKDPAADVRAACARSLGLTGRQQAAKLLARLARDPAREVRHAAILALGTLGKRAGAGGAAAARRALRDPYPPVRHAAIATLARLRGARARPTLRRIAAGDDLRSALHAGRALARHDEPQPVLDAIAKALVDRDWTLRAAAVNTASQVDDKVAWQLVVKALRDRQPAVRLAAARTLLAHGLDSSATLAAARRVLALSCGRKPSLCIQAAEIVGRQGSAAGPRRLRSLARSAKRWRHRRAALEAAQRREWGTPQISIARLADAEPRVALAAASYLYRRYR